MHRHMTGGYHDSDLRALMVVSRLPYIVILKHDLWLLWICHYEFLYIYEINDVWILNLESILVTKLGTLFYTEMKSNVLLAYLGNSVECYPWIR